MRTFLGLVVLFSALTSPVHGESEDNSSSPSKSIQVDTRIPAQKMLLPAEKTITTLGPFDSLKLLRETGEKKGKKPATVTLDQEKSLIHLEWTKPGKRDVQIEAEDSNGKVITLQFQVELWEPDYWKLAMTVIGGLGIFLIGMKNLSEGIQATAGNRLRRMIGAVTDNRFMATGVGTLVTMLVQSSSITTVITVGFVSAGLMTLAQSIGVIMGANIGTTITGWILVLKIGKYGLPILGASAFVYLFSRNEGRRYIALACMGLGMVFFGLELMKNAFSVFKALPEFKEWFLKFDASTYPGVLKCAMVGCVLTFLVQSSSATLGITIGLAAEGVIQYRTAAALVLGENIGTTITAYLASLGAPTEARRAAYFHVLFNILGVVWITAIFGWYTSVISTIISGQGDALQVTPDQATAAIAATHTGFNVANTLLFLPLTGFFARLLTRLVPEKDQQKESEHARLDMRMLESPVIGIEQSRLEVLRMAEVCKTMMEDLREILVADGTDKKQIQSILDREKSLDEVEHEVSAFITGLLESRAPHDVVDEARQQLRMADEYESVSDAISRVAKAQRRLRRADLVLPEEEKRELLKLHDAVYGYLTQVTELEIREEPGEMKETASQSATIAQQCKELMKNFLAKIPEIDPRIDVAYNRQIQSYRQVRDHVLNIAQTFAGEK